MEEVALVRLSDDVRRKVCLEFGVLLGDPASCGTHGSGWSNRERESGRVLEGRADGRRAEANGRGWMNATLLVSVSSCTSCRRTWKRLTSVCGEVKRQKAKSRLWSSLTLHSPNLELELDPVY